VPRWGGLGVAFSKKRRQQNNTKWEGGKRDDPSLLFAGREKISEQKEEMKIVLNRHVVPELWGRRKGP